jgi:hypothetical protein
MKPDFNIYFITLPENLDPDAYINQKGKVSFLKLAESKIEIQNFIWGSYFQDVDRNNPHSLSLFEKKIKSLCNDVIDKTLSKYFLDNFTQRINELTPLQGSLRYKFKDLALLNKALTHKSYSNETLLSVKNNERLEFLGDSVLDLIVGDYMFLTYQDLPEGSLSKIRAAVVNESCLAGLAHDIKLGSYLLLGKGECFSGGRQKASILPGV